jgi:hypothetical protein
MIVGILQWNGVLQIYLIMIGCVGSKMANTISSFFQIVFMQNLVYVGLNISLHHLYYCLVEVYSLHQHMLIHRC